MADPPDTSGSGVVGRRPSLRGVTYIRVSNGQEIAVKWPHGRGKRIHPKTAEQMEFFRQAQWAFKYSAWQVQQQITQAVKGTAIMPRDLFLMIVSGRLFDIMLPDGTRVYPMAGVKDISASLDWISQVPGSMLWRGEELWGGTEPPELDGLVLTSMGSVEAPKWLPSQSSTKAVWGDIIGNIADQTDLMVVFQGKQPHSAILDGLSALGTENGLVHQVDPDSFENVPFEIGTYTPTMTNQANCTNLSSPMAGYWRMREWVFLWFCVNGTFVTHPTPSQCIASLPIPSDFLVSTDATGVLGTSSSTPQAGGINADPVSNGVRMFFTSTGAGANFSLRCLCVYRIQ